MLSLFKHSSSCYRVEPHLQKFFKIVAMNIKSFTKKAINYVRSNLSNPIQDLLFQVDPAFQGLYQQGLQKTGTPPSGDTVVNKRQARFYNLINIYSLAASLDGNIAEIGCWKGLSSYMLNKTVAIKDSKHCGKNFWVIDSFEGLSESENSDQKLEDFVPHEIMPGGGSVAGSYGASLDEVKNSLSDFPNVNYLKGWVPEILDQIPDKKSWKFVHIDLDLYTPIKGAFEFFSKNMVPGGIILFDDYGSLYWPGARKAVDEVASRAGGNLVLLSTGQAFWQAPFDNQPVSEQKD